MGEGANRRRRKRALRRRLSAARYGLRQAYNVARPLLLVAFAVAGTWFGLDQLSIGPWHHNIIVWGPSLFVGGYATYAMYKAANDRLTYRRWLRSPDRDVVAGQFDKVHKIVSRLPPWHRGKYRQKRREFGL